MVCYCREVDSITQARCEARAEILKALAHPSRLFIVEKLSAGQQCVGDLTVAIGVDISTVSKHLSILKSAGIVKDEKRGSQVFYSLRIPCILRFFDCAEAVLQSVAADRRALVAN
jgi:DNA-binding transcriptional ArsR family regulator